MARNPREQSEAERVRKFLEALGLPADALPPAPQAPKQPAPRPAAPVQPAGQRAPSARPFQQAGPRRRTVDTPQPPPVPPPARVSAPRPQPETAQPAFEVSALRAQPAESETAAVAVRLPPRPTTAAPPERTPQQALREMLASRESIRAALLLREILGPPVGLADPWIAR
jgi:hypothetical protein